MINYTKQTKNFQKLRSIFENKILSESLDKKDINNFIRIHDSGWIILRILQENETKIDNEIRFLLDNKSLNSSNKIINYQEEYRHISINKIIKLIKEKKENYFKIPHSQFTKQYFQWDLDSLEDYRLVEKKKIFFFWKRYKITNKGLLFILLLDLALKDNKDFMKTWLRPIWRNW